MKKMPEQFPHLRALYGRGSAAYTGAPLSFLLIEVCGGKLYITGEMPLRDDGDHYTAPGSAYQYVLDGYAAERLLSALARSSQKVPEAVIAEEFEFSRPGNPLKDYLDSLGINYNYCAN